MIGTPTTVTLQRATISTSDTSAEYDSWENIRKITGVLNPPTGSQANKYDKLNIETDSILLIDIPKGFSVEVADRIYNSGVYYDVVHTMEYKHLEVALKRDNGR